MLGIHTSHTLKIVWKRCLVSLSVFFVQHARLALKRGIHSEIKLA